MIRSYICSYYHNDPCFFLFLFFPLEFECHVALRLLFLFSELRHQIRGFERSTLCLAAHHRHCTFCALSVREKIHVLGMMFLQLPHWLQSSASPVPLVYLPFCSL